MMQRLLPSVFFVFLFTQLLPGQKAGPLAHTYSIVAADLERGEIGVAVQSHWFAVGASVAWSEAGVGAIATQSFINPDFGPQGLRFLRRGLPADAVLDSLIAGDSGRDYRQLALVDRHGRVAVYTGRKCIAYAGHIEGVNYSVQANMMLNDKVIPAMDKAMRETQGDLAARLMAALQAAQAMGGDIRGQQSAAIAVVRANASGSVSDDKIVDIRVDDHPRAVAELARVLRTHRAFVHMSNGDLAIEAGNTEAALREYSAAEAMFPNNLEMKYWKAVALANAGRVAESLPIFKQVFTADINWKILTPRLIGNGLLNVSTEDLREITAQ
jgi:uncharacterized Ntn-hydrolase superfamily protein